MVEPLGRGGWAQYAYCLLSHISADLKRVTLFTSAATHFQERELPYQLKPVLFSISNALISALHLSRPRLLRRVMKALEIPINHLKILNYCLRERPDILHFHAAYWFEALIIPLYKLLGIKIVYTAHDLLHHPPYPGDRYLFRHLYRKLDAIIVTARSLKSGLIDQFSGVESSKVDVIRIGNIDELEVGVEITRGQARKSLDLPLTGPIILFFGIIRPYKGLDVLIRAFGLLIRKLPSARLVIAGQPIGSFTSYRNLIDELGIRDQVDLFLHFIPQDETPSFFTAVDIVAVPYNESYTSAIIPLAYSYNRPVIVSRVGGLPEYVRDEESGYIFPPGDYSSLAEKLFLALLNQETIERMKESAGEYYRVNLSWDKIAGEYLDLYRSIAGPQDNLSPSIGIANNSDLKK